MSRVQRLSGTARLIYSTDDSDGDEGDLDPSTEASLLRDILTGQEAETLDLKFRHMGMSAVAALCRAVSASTTLRSIDLWQCQLGDEGCSALARALRGNDTLVSLDLGNNGIGDKGCRALQHFYKPCDYPTIPNKLRQVSPLFWAELHRIACGYGDDPLARQGASKSVGRGGKTRPTPTPKRKEREREKERDKSRGRSIPLPRPHFSLSTSPPPALPTPYPAAKRGAQEAERERERKAQTIREMTTSPLLSYLPPPPGVSPFASHMDALPPSAGVPPPIRPVLPPFPGSHSLSLPRSESDRDGGIERERDRNSLSLANQYRASTPTFGQGRLEGMGSLDPLGAEGGDGYAYGYNPHDLMSTPLCHTPFAGSPVDMNRLARASSPTPTSRGIDTGVTLPSAFPSHPMGGSIELDLDLDLGINGSSVQCSTFEDMDMYEGVGGRDHNDLPLPSGSGAQGVGSALDGMEHGQAVGIGVRPSQESPAKGKDPLAALLDIQVSVMDGRGHARTQAQEAEDEYEAKE
ncbi:hypothetical protein KIPB_005770 [Kipferlia bialata]|uniref:Uncharacterized protein n=1 Tax=Kipferlia bialata TaxID=797122 RepID=A0A9K3CXW5_9EUKA|nr:hypothetical protein KIPB_005770 [Kipferlia bialata]|eukprot:g5770.t1